ncbi:MAG: toll/interleukin-1 receptor domain-containing protein [Acidobacteriota bacterium]
MRIHLVGSVPNNDYSREEEDIERGLRDHRDFFEAAAEIGRTCAERGHTLVVGSDFRLTVDHHAVLKGLVPVVERYPERTFHIEVWRPNDPKRPFEMLKVDYPESVRIDHFMSSPGFPLQHRRNPHAGTVNTNLWTFAHQSALANADVLLAMGGTTGTERSVHMARELGVPALPVSTFGGGAARAYRSFETELMKLPGGHALSANWSGVRALDLVSLAERVGTHSYFISYSHQHIEWCDLVHLGLYTRGRVVLRDRDELTIGRDVQSKLMNAIGKAETFILLWSKEASESKWCRREILKAIELKNSGLPPRRIVMLRRDDTPPPDELQDLLWLEARTRSDTDSAVNRVVAEESLH